MNSYFILSIKPNLTIDDVVSFLNKITENGERTFTNLFTALPYHLLKEASEKFASSGIIFGSPYLGNIDPESFTGPIAVELVKNAGAQFVLIGTREERNSLHGKDLDKKIEVAIQNQLQPIFCIGETYNERQEEKSLEVLKEQLSDVKDFQVDQRLIIVYQIPFRSFQDYLPNLNEIENAYQLCQEAAEEVPEELKEKISWAIELPVDLAGFSENISDYPFKGFYFIKSGIFPHAVHSEAQKLFQIHSP